MVLGGAVSDVGRRDRAAAQDLPESGWMGEAKRREDEKRVDCAPWCCRAYSVSMLWRWCWDAWAV